MAMEDTLIRHIPCVQHMLPSDSFNSYRASLLDQQAQQQQNMKT